MMSPQLIFSIISSLCLIISEILPFITKFDSNGLLQLLLNISKGIVKDKNSDERLPLLNENNNTNFLHNNTNNTNNNFLHNNTNNTNNEVVNEDVRYGSDDNFGIKNNLINQNETPGYQTSCLINKLDTLNSNVNNITTTLNHYITEAQTSRQLKLQPMEFYELNYIINFIKVNYHKKMYQTKFLSKINKQLLTSQGYIIDYDYQNDMHTVKW